MGRRPTNVHENHANVEAANGESGLPGAGQVFEGPSPLNAIASGHLTHYSDFSNFLNLASPRSGSRLLSCSYHPRCLSPPAAAFSRAAIAGFKSPSIE